MKNQATSIDILGVSFSGRSKQETYQFIRTLLQTRANARIFTPNPEILWRAHRDHALKNLLNTADLLLPDGIGILLAARLAGKKIPERITGIDTGERVLRYAAEHSLSVFLLGGKEGVAERAKEKLTAKHPTLTVCGAHHGYFDKSKDGRENQAVLKQIKNASPDILFVCFGFPAQEMWIAENTPSLPSLRLSMGLGGALDVWSGDLPRASKPIQAFGMEWLWRTIKEPARIQRLRYIPSFFKAVIASRR